MKYFWITLLLITQLAYSEIYKHTDEKGRVYYTDQPPENTEAEVVELEPDIKYGPLDQNSSNAGAHLRKQDLRRQRAAKQQSIANAEQRRRDKDILRAKCEQAKADMEDFKDMYNTSNSRYDRGYYDGRMAILKRKIDNACKLSNFR